MLALVLSVLLAGLISTAFAGFTVRSTSQSPPEMVFASDRDGNPEVYAMRADGRLQRRLTVDPAADVDPTISGSGLVVFASDRAGSFDLFAMSPDGQAVTRLTSMGGDERRPSLSPDGSQIAFSHAGDIFVMNANGRRRLVRNLTSHRANDSDPTWSPDGRRIAFSSDRGGAREIFIVRVGLRRATPVTRSGANFAPDWSPDGATIAFEHGADVRVVAPDEGAERTVAPTERTVARGVSAPSFSPDGRELAVADGRDVLRVSLGGALVANLSFSAAVDGAPDWHGESR